MAIGLNGDGFPSLSRPRRAYQADVTDGCVSRSTSHATSAPGQNQASISVSAADMWLYSTDADRLKPPASSLQTSRPK